MPEPNRPPFTLAEDLPPSLEIKQIIERGSGLTIEVDPGFGTGSLIGKRPFRC